MKISISKPKYTNPETYLISIRRGCREEGARFNAPRAHLVRLHWRSPLDKPGLAVERVEAARVNPRALQHTSHLDIDLLGQAVGVDLDAPASVHRLDLPLVRDLRLECGGFQNKRFNTAP